MHGLYLEEVLETLMTQSYSNYEIIIINSGDNSKISKLSDNYGAKELNLRGSLLQARYLGASQSKGEFILNLDETRPLVTNNALELLMSHHSDIVFINEMEVITNYLTKMAAIDKDSIFTKSNIESYRNFVLPRFYKNNLYMNSINKVKSNLGKYYYEADILPEDLLIYREALKISTNYSIEFTKIIKHYANVTLKDVVRKYFRYGRGIGFLKKTHYNSFGKITSKERIIGRFDFDRSYFDILFQIYLLGVRGISAKLGEIYETSKIVH